MTTADLKNKNYFGAKAQAAPLIIGHMPRHTTYVELFLGSGQVMKRKPRAPINIGVEMSAAVAAKYNYPSGAQIITGCAIEYVAQQTLAPHKDPLYYADPPYHPDTRTSRHGYEHELTDKGHRRLLRALKGLDAPVMLSGYRCALYDDELADWRRVDYDIMTRGGMRVESLWLNFPQAEPYHHSQAGRNKAERQAIKRKAQRWARMYAAMTRGEQLAMRAALCAVDAEQPFLIDRDARA